MILETFSNLNDCMTQILDSHWGTSTCSEHWIGYTSALLWLLVLWETPIGETSGEPCLQRSEEHVAMSHALLVAWEGHCRKQPGYRGWVVGVRSLHSQRKLGGGGDVLWRGRRGRADPACAVMLDACSVLSEQRSCCAPAQLTRSTLLCLKRSRDLNPWVTSKQLEGD